jgi:two-component system, cell cycle response regulator DivK
MSISGSRSKAKLVLFVDDDADSREAQAFALRDAGLLVDEVATLQEAVAIAPRLTPDIIVLDRYLPDGDGWEAARQLKANPSLREVPIIGFTANLRGRADVENALVAGCDIFLEKPCSPSALVRHVLGLLGLPFEDEELKTATVRKLA